MLIFFVTRSKEFVSFVQACLHKDAEERPTARDLRKHPFITGAKGPESLKDLIALAMKNKKKVQKLFLLQSPYSDACKR